MSSGNSASPSILRRNTGAANIGTASGNDLETVLATLATLASPALTGTPTAPTAAASANTTQIATTAMVQAALAALVDSSPAALNTLNELAAALGDDPNFATTVTNALALKAPLASPALTGTPTGPTPAVDTNTTQLATTAFVLAQIAASVVGDHHVHLHTTNGYGSTFTSARRWTTTIENVGTAITYTDSAANGAEFAISEDGIYSVTFQDFSSTASANYLAIVKNQRNFPSSGNPDRLLAYIEDYGYGYEKTATWVGKLADGDYITAQTNGNQSSWATQFSIRKIANF